MKGDRSLHMAVMTVAALVAVVAVLLVGSLAPADHVSGTVTSTTTTTTTTTNLCSLGGIVVPCVLVVPDARTADR